MQARESSCLYTLGSTDGGSLRCDVTFVYASAPANVEQCTPSQLGTVRSSGVHHINFASICEALSFMVKEPATPHLSGLTVTCKTELHAETVTVILFCVMACSSSLAAQKIRPWVIRIMGQTLLLHFYHNKALDRILVTHEDHTQQITREFVGWIPCPRSLGEAVVEDIGGCDCSTLRGLWTIEDRCSHFQKRVSTVKGKLERCASNTADGTYRQVLSDIIRHVCWVLQGYCMGSREDVAQSLLATLPVSVRRDISLLYPIQSMYRLTDCQGEMREQMFACQMKEEHMRHVHNISKWISWIDGLTEV